MSMRALRDAAAARCAGLLAQEFVVRHFEALANKSSAGAKPWLLPGAFEGYNGDERAAELRAAQRRLLGEDAMSPAEQVAVIIREKAGLRQREGAAAAAAGSGRKKETVSTR